ncbi:M20/M25/M40 family metallo-hydrolase [uncultured Sutterella sp.]|uniref:M20 family metallopeptidase n=1 Tax=uncultured Sutterella sp. TaxID=286133 RepID=UPI0025CD89EF|nr:M20/M25/M40 family metallo-hydrolase [uncultured Sutterella sp.]
MASSLLPDAVAIAQTLVRIPSVSGSPAVFDVVEAVKHILEESADPSVKVHVCTAVPDAPVLLAHAGSTDPEAPSFMLSGHIDVVPPAGMEAPFSGDVKAGRLLGRGATDMKGGAAAAIAAFAQASKENLPGSLWLILSTDEETNVRGVKAALEEAGAPRPDACLIAEPTELEIHSAHRGDAWIRVDFEGRSAHSSRPHLGVNAVDAACLFAVKARKRLPEMMKEGPAKGPQTCSIDLISGGAAENVVPAHASVTIDFRFQGEETGRLQEERILRVLEECRQDPDFPDVKASTTITGDWPALADQTDAPACRRAIAALTEEVGRPLKTTPMSGWGEGGYMCAFGIPAFYFGPGEGRLAHTPQESASVEMIETAARAIHRAVRAVLCGGEVAQR